MTNLKIGSPVWVFDGNRRKYTKPEGGGFGTIIWRHHWEPLSIIGENKRSWVIGHGTFERFKLPKKGPFPKRSYCFSKDELDDACFVHENKYLLSNMVLACEDAKCLRTIASLLSEATPDAN